MRLSQLLPQQLSLYALCVMTWAGVATLSEWATIGGPSSLTTELSRAGLHALTGLSLTLSLSALRFTSHLASSLSDRVPLGYTPWLTLAGWGLWLGEELSRGDWLQAQPWVSWVTPCVGLGFALGGVALGALTRHAHTLSSQAVLALGALALSALDLGVLRGLYPQIHLTLYLLSSACALLMLQGLFARRATLTLQSPRVMSVTIPTLCVLIGSYVHLQLEGAPHLRSSLGQASPRATLTPAWRTPSVGVGDLADALSQLSTFNHDALRVERDNAQRLSELTQLDERREKHVVLIVVDTLRYDGLYQPLLTSEQQRERAPLATAGDLPFLTRWRETEAHVFLNAYTQAGRTKLSTPALFTSGEVSLKGRSGGPHLAERLKSVGYQALALTPEYFLWPVKDGASHLLDPFERSWHYTEDKQHHALKLWRTLLAQRDEARPLFAWVHLYMMHAPYFAGEKRLSRRDGSAEERYRRALKTLDLHLKELTGELRRQGMLKDTIIALTSDHGEGLGDHGTDGHGVGVFEEQSRTPFILYDARLKRARQRLHSEVVGNVDLTPTLSALAGLQTHEGDEGQSLLPLMMRGEERPSWPYSYLLSNGNGSERGLVTQARYKLSYKPRRAELSLYNLNTDPYERQSLAGQDPDHLSALTSTLITRLPTLALPKRLKRDDPEAWARSRREAIERARELIAQEETLSLALKRRLIRVATQLSAPSLIEALADKASDDSSQAWLGLEALSVDPTLGERILKSELTSTESTSALNRKLMALSAFRPSRFGEGWLSQLLSAQDPVMSDLQLWRAWLNLSQGWPHQDEDLSRYLTLLKRATGELSLPLTQALLSRMSATDSPRFIRAHPPLLPALTQLLTGALLQPDPPLIPEVELTRVALSASATLAPLFTPELRARLRARCLTLLERDDRAQLKKKAVEAMTALALTPPERSEVTQALIKRSSDRLILVPIIDALSQLPSARTLTFLKKMRRSARTGYARVSAKNALKRLTKGKRKVKRRKKRRKKRRTSQRSERSKRRRKSAQDRKPKER